MNEAALWIAQRFPVPMIPKGKHLKNVQIRGIRAGFEGDIDILVQSGIWARLSSPMRAIIPVLRQFADRDDGAPTDHVQMSYRGIGQYSGVESPNAIAKAIRELEEIHWLERIPQSSESPIQAASVFRLTPQSDELMEAANLIVSQLKNDIDIERQARKKAREERSQALRRAKQAEAV